MILKYLITWLDTVILHRGLSPVIAESTIEKQALAIKKLNAKAGKGS